MRIRLSQLKRIIKEEVEEVKAQMDEGEFDLTSKDLGVDETKKWKIVAVFNVEGTEVKSFSNKTVEEVEDKLTLDGKKLEHGDATVGDDFMTVTMERDGAGILFIVGSDTAEGGDEGVQAGMDLL